MTEKDAIAEENVQTSTPTGRPVSKRIKSARTALLLFRKLKKNDEANAMSRARICSLYDGNPPYSNTELRRRGLAWCSNVEWGEFKSTINKNATSIWNMFNQPEHILTLSTDFLDPQNPGADYGEIVANEVSRIVRSWTGYDYLSMMGAMGLMKFGYGVSVWSDLHDWRPKAVQEGCFLVPHKTKSTSEDLSTVVILDEMSPQQVFQLIEDPETSKELGWNVPALKKSMIRLYVDGIDGNPASEQSSAWESIQNTIATKVDGTNEDDLKPLRIVHLYTEELPGSNDQKVGITHQIVIEDQPEEDPFIFEKENRFDSMDQAVHVMLYHVGNGKTKSVKGLGHAIYYASHVSNRFINNIVNGATITMGLVLKPTSEVSAETSRLIRQGPVVVLPPNSELMQQQYHPNMGGIADVRNLIENINRNNGAGYRVGSDSTTPVQRTGKEVEMTMQASAAFEQDQASWLTSQRASFLREIFRRLMAKDYPPEAPGYQDHKTLMDRLNAKGLPKPLFDFENWQVSVPSAIGLGDRSMAMSISNSMIKMKGSLDEDGRIWVDRHWWSLRIGWDQVDKVIPRFSRDKVFTVAHAMAEGENVDMNHGNERTVAVDDPHKIHFDMHMKAAVELVQAATSEQTDPQQAVAALKMYLPHLVTHVVAMGQDETRSNQVKEAEEGLKQLVKAVAQLEAGVAKMIQQQQAAQRAEQERIAKLERQPTDRETELGKYKIDKQAEVMLADIEMQNNQRAAKTMTAIQTKTDESMAKIDLMYREAMAKIESASKKTNPEPKDEK